MGQFLQHLVPILVYQPRVLKIPGCKGLFFGFFRICTSHETLHRGFSGNIETHTNKNNADYAGHGGF
jgi:hypothetical protein